MINCPSKLAFLFFYIVVFHLSEGIAWKMNTLKIKEYKVFKLIEMPVKTVSEKSKESYFFFDVA